MLLAVIESSRLWLTNIQNLRTVSALQMVPAASQLYSGIDAVVTKVVVKWEVLIVKEKIKI